MKVLALFKNDVLQGYYRDLYFEAVDKDFEFVMNRMLAEHYETQQAAEKLLARLNKEFMFSEQEKLAIEDFPPFTNGEIGAAIMAIAKTMICRDVTSAQACDKQYNKEQKATMMQNGVDGERADELLSLGADCFDYSYENE